MSAIIKYCWDSLSADFSVCILKVTVIQSCISFKFV